MNDELDWRFLSATFGHGFHSGPEESLCHSLRLSTPVGIFWLKANLKTRKEQMRIVIVMTTKG
jgi:hypothetical protein